ncbi:MAG: hypothetical protein FH762_14795 [Firmicutes bacterium]|nr:hypothetical protein [Bacillota bacterium]
MSKKLTVLLVILVTVSILIGCKDNSKMVLKIEDGKYNQQNIKQAVDVIQKRLINYGFKNVSFVKQDGDKVFFKISESANMNNIGNTINYLVNNPGVLFFKDSTGKILLTNEDIGEVEASKNNYGWPVVDISLNKKGTKKFEKITNEYMGKKIGIYLDGVLLTNPTVMARITDGKAMITGYKSMEGAKKATAIIKTGPLTVLMKFEAIEN